jgi:predicted GNAT superfamily acetyltransferase
MPITIRPTSKIEDYEAIEWLQAEIWGPIGISPTHLVLTIAKESGVVLLAEDDGRPIGFVFGFLALTGEGRLKLASHQAGVLPRYQSQGIGYRLKLAQREAALAKNIDLITWTYDPLQGRNARLNLNKLGAVCNTYLPNLYGNMADALNQGLPTDRFRVDWWLASPHVKQRLAGAETPLNWNAYPVLNEGRQLANGLIAPPDRFATPDGSFCLVEIPADIAPFKTEAPELALQWRLQTREIFETVFAMGYTAVDLLRRENRNYYLLQKNWLQETTNEN